MEGSYCIEYWAVDAAGNEETPHHIISFRVMLENKAVELLYFCGPYEWNGTHWDITSGTLVCFDMEKAEEIGITEIWYRIDKEGNWTKYTDCFTVPEGMHSIYYYCIDKLGRYTQTARDVVDVVGSLAPITTCILNPSEPNGNDGWYTTNVTATLTPLIIFLE